MRTWERVTYLEHCGGCGAELSADTPVQVITRQGLKRKLLRCAKCAEGQVPDDLPARPAKIDLEDQIGRMRALSVAMPTRTRGALKQAAREYLPYREPGEDD